MNITNPLALTDKFILVTGASSGIGRASAVLAAELGASLVLAGRNLDALNGTLQLLANQERHRIESFDLRKYDGIGEWMRRICDQDGRKLDGVVHSAGISLTVPLRAMRHKHVDDVMQTNVYSSLGVLGGVASKFVANDRASVVLLSSIASVAGFAGFSAYSASKGALNSLIRSASSEFAARKIRVNCVAPTYVAGTPMVEAQAAKVPGELIGQSRSFLGLPSAEEIAVSIAYFLSDAASTITGQTLVIDGGYSC